MIWSTRESQVELVRTQLQTAGMLKMSGMIHEHLALIDADVEPVSYFQVPKGAGRHPKLIQPYANINPAGYLTHPSRSVFAVESRIFDIARPLVSRELLEEANVVAERTALSRGLFTPYGRSTSEVIVAQAVPNYLLNEYIDRRVDYLTGLQGEAQTYEGRDLSQARRDTLQEEISRAITALEAVID